MPLARNCRLHSCLETISNYCSLAHAKTCQAHSPPVQKVGIFCMHDMLLLWFYISDGAVILAGARLPLTAVTWSVIGLITHQTITYAGVTQLMRTDAAMNEREATRLQAKM